MILLNQLKENKGTVSSALGKELAKDVLNGRLDILTDALELIHFEDKNVRSGAAKIIEKVAEEKPALISDHLSELVVCMNYPESQTRWMVLHIAGLCAHLVPDISRDFFFDAVKYLDKSHGTVLNDRAITYLGYMGAVSEEDCRNSYPYLIESFDSHSNRITRIFESLSRMIELLDKSARLKVLEYANIHATNEKKSVQKWAAIITKELIFHKPY